MFCYCIFRYYIFFREVHNHHHKRTTGSAATTTAATTTTTAHDTPNEYESVMVNDNYVAIVDPTGDVCIGIQQISLDIHDDAPDVDMDVLGFLPQRILRSAKEILDSGRNVVVKPANSFYRNEIYVNYWNRYARGLNLWVKFVDEWSMDSHRNVDPDSVKMIIVM
jgi:hypothetical protein